MASNYSIRVLERVAEILGCFTLNGPEKSLTELSRESGLNKSTVFRILDTLEGMGWVARESRTGLYRLGLGVFELGSRAVNGLDFYKVSSPHLEQLVKVTGQTAHLAIHDNGEVLYLNKLENPGSFISQPSNIGLRLPMHCTAVGKVLLAFDSDQQKVQEILARKGLEKFTEKTITTIEELSKELDDIRSKGYAIDDEEIQTGLRCVAAPIGDYTRKVVAAISVSGLSSNFNDRRMPLLTNEVVKVGQCISRDLGFTSRDRAIF